jgi:hypothetical protein
MPDFLNGTTMQISIIQTSDPCKYIPLLAETSRTVSAYCNKHGFRQEIYIGIKRGYFPWHAAFNRIFILKEFLERQELGWALYIDADAYIANFNFDLRKYLENKTNNVMIATHGASDDVAWDINSGVFLLNLDHVLARPLVERWLASFLAIDNDALRRMETWPIGGGDQWHLQEVLKTIPIFCEHIHYANKDLFNSPGATFIRQHLREEHPDFSSRLYQTREEVGRLLAEVADSENFIPMVHAEVEKASPQEKSVRHESDLVEAIYRGLLGRGADQAGLDAYIALINERGITKGVAEVIKIVSLSSEFRALRR